MSNGPIYDEFLRRLRTQDGAGAASQDEIFKAENGKIYVANWTISGTLTGSLAHDKSQQNIADFVGTAGSYLACLSFNASQKKWTFWERDALAWELTASADAGAEKLKFVGDDREFSLVKGWEEYGDITKLCDQALLATEGQDDGVMPAARAALANKIYLYTGTTTEEYTKGEFYKCTWSDGRYVWQHIRIDSLPVGSCSNIRCITQGTTVRLKWKDPEDLYIRDVRAAIWDRTIIVRKAGSVPQHFNDGTRIVTNTLRNQYSTTAFVDRIPDGSTTYYYAFFTFTKDEAWQLAGEAQNGELSWAAIQDIGRSGDAASYFAAGDALTISMTNQQLASPANYDLEFAAFDKCIAADLDFVRDSASDSGAGIAWTCAAENYTIFTGSNAPAPGSAAYYDDGLTIETATVVRLAGNTLTATPKHCVTLEWKQCCEGMQFCPAEKTYGKTWDRFYRPDSRLELQIKGAAAVTKFIIENGETTGTDRLYWSVNGANKLYYNATTSRWEIWATNGGSHQTTGTTPVDYQTTGTADPWTGTWNAATTVSKSKVYYTKTGDNYTAMEEGTDYTAGDAITGDVYEQNQHNDRVSYGWNRWSTSPLRKYLNATGTEWYADGSPFSNEPGYKNYHGFLDRLPADFLAVIGKTKVLTAINTVESGGGSEYTEDYFFLPSRKEVFGQNEDSGVAEGSQFDLWTGATDTDRQKYLINGSATYWWLRSPVTGNAHYVRNVNTSGAISNYYAFYSYGVAPACNII